MAHLRVPALPLQPLDDLNQSPLFRRRANTREKDQMRTNSIDSSETNGYISKDSNTHFRNGHKGIVVNKDSKMVNNNKWVFSWGLGGRRLLWSAYFLKPFLYNTDYYLSISVHTNTVFQISWISGNNITYSGTNCKLPPFHARSSKNDERLISQHRYH